MATLKELRERQKLSQFQLAEALGLTRSAVSDWERGICRPRLYLPQTKELCRILKCKLKDIEDATNNA